MEMVFDLSAEKFAPFYLLFCESNIEFWLTNEISKRINAGQEKLNENNETTTDTIAVNGKHLKSMRCSSSAM